MPLQLAKPLANVPWRHSSETLERQQDSSPRHAKHKPEKLCERYLYQWQMPLGGTVPKHSNTSRIRAQGMQNTSQKNSPNVTFGIHKNNSSIAREMPLQLAKPLANAPWRHSSETLERQQDSKPKACKTQARKTLRAQGMQSTSQKNSANATFTSGKCPLEAQFRNTRTPAGFEPKACKTQARKTLRTLPLESIKNNNSIAREMPLQLAKPLANVPWRHSSETLERQQDSSPRHAKHKPEKRCERYLYQWQMSLRGTVPKHSNTSRIRAQGMQNTSQKNSPNVTFGIHKKQQFYRPWDSSPASKTIGKCPLEAQFRNTRTPAGFEPKACKTQARKTLRTSPLESIKNNNGIAREIPLQLAKPLANVPWRHSSETLEHQQDSSPRHAKHKPEKLSERHLWNP